MGKWFSGHLLGYIFKRVLIFIPTMFIITLVGFTLSVNAPGDPVERILTAASSSGETNSNAVNQEEDRRACREKLGLNLPVFYFTLTKFSYPDTLYRIYDRQEKEALGRLIDEYGNWEQIAVYYKSLCVLDKKLKEFRLSDDELNGYDKNAAAENLNTISYDVLALRSTFKDDLIQYKFKTLTETIAAAPYLQRFKNDVTEIRSLYEGVKTKTSNWKNFIPAVYFFGKNQYHRWLFGDGKFTKGLLRFDFGISLQNSQPITEKIKERIPWSMFFSIVAVVLSYIISIPLGVFAAQYRGSKFDKISSFILYALFSLPSFFVALLLITFFSNPDFLGWLPAIGIKPAEGYPEDSGFFSKAMISLPYIILPLLSYTYHSFAYLSRTMRSSMLESVNQDYVRTARAKGLSEKKVIWKHAFRNSLLPIITLFANIFPAAISGSVIIEYIFTIPGMGNEIVASSLGNDYPMIIAVLTITGMLTLIGYLFSDILYSIADPRIKTA